MRYLRLAAVIIFVAAFISCTTTNTSNDTTQQKTHARIESIVPGESIVVLNHLGERLGAFTPRSAPYNETDGPAFIAWLAGNGGTAEDGRAVPAVKFIGWNEGQWTHVRAFALVAKPGAKNVHNEKDLESRPLGEYVMHKVESAPVSEMARYGVPPLIVKAGESKSGS
jgi:hypothetical protein